MKKHIQIKNSYKVWNSNKMIKIIVSEIHYQIPDNYRSLIVEWWIHNLVYYLTKPFCKIPVMKRLNLRAKDVDLIIKFEDERNEDE